VGRDQSLDGELGHPERAAAAQAAQTVRPVVSRAAAADLKRLHAFLADKDAAAARRAVDALIAAIQSLEAFPDRGRSSGIPGARELIVPFGRSAYVLRYFRSPRIGSVVVLRIWHGREARA
jgi:toxin ParE1/3/4